MQTSPITPSSSCHDILSGWKEIANYLGKSVRSVQRYELEFALPVRRPAGRRGGSVIATRAELGAWINASPVRDASLRPPLPDKDPAILADFTNLLTENRRLLEETFRLREEIRNARKRLRNAVQIIVRATSPEPFAPALCPRPLPRLLRWQSPHPGVA